VSGTDVAAVIGAVGALGCLLGRSRAVVAGGLVGIGAAEALLSRTFAPSVFDRLASPAGGVLVVVGAVAFAALAAGFVRFAVVVPLVMVAFAPLRLPFDFNTSKRFFIGLGEAGALGRLMPLYTALAAAAGALVWRLARGEKARVLPPLLAVPGALLIALMSLSLLWARDTAAAANRLGFFVLPFAVLFAVMSYAPFRAWLPRALAIEAVALGCLFAVIGIGEEWSHHLFFYEPKLAVANSYTSYFRVTSLFSDPSIYARHVVVALTVLVVALLLGRVSVAVAVPLLAVMWIGLYFSYSQSAMVSLAAATVLVTALAGGARVRRLLAAAVLALVVLGSAAFVTLQSNHSPDRLLSGRWTLVKDTWAVYENHPLVGVGVASQPAASRDETSGARSKRLKTSHTAPLTVAAELGIAGILVYVAFLAGAALFFWRLRTDDDALGLALLGVLTVLVTHSLSYGVFFEDPVLWVALGVGAAAVLGREPRAASLPPLPQRAVSAPAPAAR
jgi:putative inorganic carbon (HCO3(-)) transporter